MGGHETPLEHLRAAEKVTAERGHPAESLVRTASGHILTPPGFSDTAFDLSPRAQRAVAARSVEASQWGMPAGADYVSHHWVSAAATDPDNFSRLEFPAWYFTYASAPGDYWGAQAGPASVYGNVTDIRLAPDGNTAITLQFCRDPGIAGLNQAEHCLFAHDLVSGKMRLITRMHDGTEGFGDLSVSPDGRFLLAGFPVPQLVDIRTGHCAGIGTAYRAATWYPRGGASCVLAVTGGNDEPPWKLVVIDLATFAVQGLADLPRRVDGITVANDGTIAARMRAEGERGWVDQLMVSTDDGKSFQPVASARGASGWLRRTTRPRWIEPVPAAQPVTLNARFEEFLRDVPADNERSHGEISWVLETAAYLIRHRVTSLPGRPPATDAILGQLRILAALALLDPGMTAEVVRQVVPAVRAAWSRHSRRAAQEISDIATRRQPPPFSITFGTPV